MRFFKEGKSKSPVIPVAIGMIIVIALVISVSGTRTDSQLYTEGTWTGNAFTSDFLGLQFTLPEGWTAASQEELDALMQQAMDQSREDDPETAQGYENGKVKNAYELKATQENGDGMVVIIVQKMMISAENYLNKLVEQYGDMVSNSNLPNWTLGGKDYKGLKLEIDGKIQYIYAYYEDGYFTTIQMSGTSDLDVMALRDEQFTDYPASEG